MKLLNAERAVVEIERSVVPGSSTVKRTFPVSRRVMWCRI